MGLIKEPKNVDLIVQSSPWSKEELALLSAIIRKSKKKKVTRTNKKRSSNVSKKHWA